MTKDIFAVTDRAYYNYLLDAFFHGRVNVIPPGTFDLSLFNNKWYLYWGPFPALFILPFYLISGVYASDVFYTLLAGILNVFLFGILIEEFIKYFKLKVSFFSKLFILLSFAFISPNFNLSLKGNIWSTYHVIAIFYFIIFLLFYFKFLNNRKKVFFLGLSVLFFNLAWLSRYTLIFNAILFIYPLYLIFRTKNAKFFKKVILMISVTTLIFFGLFLYYNNLKFGNPLETGLRYQVGTERYKNSLKNNKIFSFDYIPYNFTYYFLNHLSFSSKKPFIHASPEGNSIVSVYPIFFLTPFLLKRKYLKNRRYFGFLTTVLLIVIFYLATLMVYFAPGWGFGNRFFLDLVPLLYLSFLFLMDEIPLTVQVLILTYGIVVNFLGALLFY